MGILSYVLDKLVSHSEVVNTPSSGITTTKFVFIAGSVALVLFGMGYALYGLGSVAKPLSKIVEELNDSDSSDSSDSSEEKSDKKESNKDISDYSLVIHDSNDAEESNSSDQ